MKRSVLIDNWTLQDVGNLLSNGLTHDSMHEIEISQDRTKHEFIEVPGGFIQFDALLTLITNIVLYDELAVDEGFTHTWSESDTDFGTLVDASLLQPLPFSELGAPLKRLRRQIVNELAVTPTLESEDDKLRSQWRANQNTSNPHLSALLWGGAGMLARSQLTEMPYFGHPCRRRLIRESRIFAPRRDAWGRVEKTVNTGRTQMFKFRHGDIEGAHASFHLPPIAVDVIEASTSLNDLIQTAIQAREAYSKLRNWLSEYQKALDSDDEKKQMSYERVLKSVAQNVESQYQDSEDDSTGISLSVGWFQIGVPGKPIETIKNRFGVRSMLVNLMVSSRGEHALRKLLKMLNEGYSTYGKEVLTFMRTRYSQQKAISRNVE